MEVESPEREKVGGIAMEIPASWSPPRVPPRLLRKLSEPKTPLSTAEQIDAKLRGADLRRQKFYEYLSSKARPKPRSPSQSPTHGEDLGQRLEAKLQAAEEKRMSILAKAKLRLAKLDESRQAAKTGAEMRFRQEREELGSKVELRVQQAEANRLLLLKAYSQRRAALRERTSQSLLRRMARESKHKERVRTAICQKRAAAEKKRMGLLEAEKRRACARVMQARRVAKSVSHQEEIKRREMQMKIEDKLQRAKRQRAEYLMQRGRSYNSFSGSDDKIHDQAELLSRKLARFWKQFLAREKTTFHLAKAYSMLNISESSAKVTPFERLALKIESPGTLQTAKGLLDRLELRFNLLREVNNPANTGSADIDHLLKRVASPRRKATPRRFPRSGSCAKKKVSNSPAAKVLVKLSRYPVRIVLCAYMIVAHPDAVFSGKGEREIALASTAETFVREFELLVKIILNGPEQTSDGHSHCGLARRKTFRSQLVEFDSAWCSYLNSFVVWKVKDAQCLEEDLVRAACQLELSMIQKCRMTLEGESAALTHDLKAIQKQVTEDQSLLREKVLNLSGDAGIERMDNAISDTRNKYFQAKENGSPVGSPIMHSISPSPTALPTASSSLGGSNKGENFLQQEGGDQKPNRVVRSLFRDEPHPKEVGSSANNSMQSYRNDVGLMENELIVNESLHEQHLEFSESPKVADKVESIKDKVRETMEKAFWDSVLESIRKDEPQYNQVVDLMREARDELCGLAPQSWRQEIKEAIDIDILSQLLISGKLDMEYLQKIMDFAMVTLQKLSSPAKEEELKANCEKLFRELADLCQDGSGNSFILALVRGLRFVLEEIQLLKQEISKARIRMLEPILKGPAAFDYLRKAFTKRYGSPSVAMTALPLTWQWLLSVKDSKDGEWNEHKEALELTSGPDRFLPPATLRTGGSLSLKLNQDLSSPSSSTEAVDELQECRGDNVDLLVRLGLLKLVNAVSGLTQEVLPETMQLNFFRLRAIQAKLQKIIVIATSVLVQRQVLLSTQMVSTAVDMEKIVQESVKALSELLDSNNDAGIQEIIETLVKPLEHGDYDTDAMKQLQQTKEIMARMLSKSLQAGDAVFIRVTRAIYLAGRGVVLGGTSRQGRELTEMALRQVGATALIDEIVEAASVLVKAALVTVNVHGPWYAQLVDNM